MPKRKVRWLGLVFFIFLHVVGIVGTPLYIYYRGITAPELVLFFVFCAATGISITMGYHRLFAHPTYKASPVVRFLFLLFGAATFEESALKWSSQHRQHHLFTDTEHDPYGVNQGFWHAHIGWIMFWRHRTNYNNVKDLRRSKLVAHQHDHHAWWSVGGGLVLPMLIAWWIGHPLGGFIMAVCLRIVVVLHSSFFINSFAHTFGKQTLRFLPVRARQLAMRPAHQRRGLPQFPPPFPDGLPQRLSAGITGIPRSGASISLSKLGLAWDLKRTSEQRIAEAAGH